MQLKKIVLKNGLTILLDKIDSPITSAYTGFKSGSADESKNLKGTTHFLEHLLFSNEKNKLSPYELISSKGGELNAFTELHQMYLKGSILKENTRSLMKEELNLITNSHIDKQKLEQEKSIILQEKSLGEPWAKMGSIWFKNILLKPQQDLNVLGSPEDITSMNLLKIKKRLSQIKKGNNIRIIISGDFNEEKIINQVEEKLGDIKKGSIRRKEEVFKKPGESEIELNLNNQFIYFFFKSSFKKKDYLSSLILEEYLYKQLIKEMRVKKGLTYDFEKTFSYFLNKKLMGMGTGIKEDKKEETRKAIEKEIEKIKQGKINENLLKSSKNKIKFIKLKLEIKPNERVKVITFLDNYNLLSLFGKFNEEINKITSKDLTNFANKELTEKKLYWITVNPKKK